MTPRVLALAVLFATAAALALPARAGAEGPPGVPPGGAIATSTSSAPPGQYHALNPIRLLDTRLDHSTLGGGGSLALAVAGRNPVPATGVTAVVINVAVTDTTDYGWLAAFPDGTQLPGTSTINWRPGENRANLAVVPLGQDGAIRFFNVAGKVDLVVDLEGYFSNAPGQGTGGLFRPVMPARLLDTRDGTGGLGRLVAGQAQTLQVSGRGNVPSAGVSAVILNVTVTGPSAYSWMLVYPAGGALPTASTLNFAPNQTIPNRVVVSLGPGGRVSLYNEVGSADVVIDVTGWFTDGSDPNATGGLFTPVTPSRILDTRNGTGGRSGPLGSHGQISIPIAGQGGVPATGASAVVLNLTAADTETDGWLAGYPAGDWLPLTSDLNWPGPSQTVANVAVVGLGSGGAVTLFNELGQADLVADLSGWFSSAPAAGTLPGAPALSSASASGSSVSLAWGAPASTGGTQLTSYSVLASPGGWMWASSGSRSGITITDIPCGVAYTFQVAASNATGTGPPSASSGQVLPACPSNVISNVPWIHQAYSLSCEEAALQMALAHEGISVSQTQILQQMGIDWTHPGAGYNGGGDPYRDFVGDPNGSEIYRTGYGTYHPTIARVAQNHGGRVLASGHWISPQTLYANLLAGHPVIAWVTYDWRTPPRSDYTAWDGRRIPYAGPDEHAVTLVGVNQGSVLVNDPDRGQYWVWKTTFQAAYGVYSDMAVVIA